MTLIAGFDIETTGLEPGEHRVIEAYNGLWNLKAKSLIREFAKRFDPQRSIQAEASRVHGIVAADLIGCPLFADYAALLHRDLNAADAIVAHNGAGFDLPFINAEFERVGLPKIEKPVIDTMLLGRHATFDGKLPTLQELCLAYDVPYDPALAHAADYDVHCMIQCFFKGHEWGLFPLPTSTVSELTDAA